MVVRRTMKIRYYLDHLNGEDVIVMTMGTRTRLIPFMQAWRRHYAKRYLREHSQMSEN